WHQVQAIALQRFGTIALWDPFVYFGQSLIGQLQPAVASPFSWLLMAAPLSRSGHFDQQVLNLWVVLIHYCGSLFAWFFLRSLKLSRTAAVLGGLFYGIAGYVGTTTWPQIVSGAIWTPLVFLFLLRSLRGERPYSSAASAGFFLGMSWLSGHHVPPTFLSLAAIGLLIFVLLTRWGQWREVASRSAVFLAVTVLVSLVQTLPTAEYARRAVRWISTGPVAWNQQIAFPELELGSLKPWDLGHLILPGGGKNADPIVGIVAASLVVLALMALLRRFEVRLFAALGAISLLLALAKNDVLYGPLYFFVPMVEKAREPAGWLHVTHFSVTVLVAFGLDAALDRLNVRLLARVVRWTVIFALGVFAIWLILESLKPAVNSNLEGDDRLFIVGLIAALLAGLYTAWSREFIGHRGLIGGLAVLLMIELGNSAGYYSFAHRSEPDRWASVRALSDGDEIAAFLRKEPQPLRASVSRTDLPVNFGDQYGIDTVEAYLAGISTEVTQLAWSTHRIASMMGVGYIVARQAPAGAQEVFAASNGIKVFRNPDAFPRAWTVHRVMEADEPRAVDAVNRTAEDFRTAAYVSGAAPALETCPEADRVASVREGIQSVEIGVTMACRGLLVLSDSWYPGWAATIDGASASILKVNGVIRGVVVDKGTHQVRFVYRPVSVMAGLGGTLAGTAIVLFLWRRREPAGTPLVSSDLTKT
ncbi:MAG TPA: hypothetical protein VEF06_15080, partial [Bryobacteraceae bacterium]|nr:hypothetical protein [Bryobacteraceae bacterium]